MKINLKILFKLILLFGTTQLIAQPSTSIYFTTAFPVNEFESFTDDVGFGGNIEMLFISPSKQKPVALGISFSYLGQGLSLFYDPCECETYIDNNRAINYLNLSMILQVAPTGGTVRPYIETFFGGSYIFSNTEIEVSYYSQENLYIDDWAWTYGFGGGIKFLLGTEENEDGTFYLDIKGRYLMSSDIHLLDRNSIRYANDQFYYDINQTQINFIAVQIGVVHYF